MAHWRSVPRRRSPGGAARTRGQRQGTAASGPAATPAPLSAPCGPSSTQAFLPRGGEALWSPGLGWDSGRCGDSGSFPRAWRLLPGPVWELVADKYRGRGRRMHPAQGRPALNGLQVLLVM